MASCMPPVAVLGLLCLLAANASALTLQQIKNMAKMPRQMCGQRTGVASDLVVKMHEGDFAEDQKLKCYVKCCMSMMQMMKKDAYNAEAALGQADKLLPDSHKARTKEAINKCKDKGDGVADSCDAAFQITKCIYQADPEVFLFP